MGVKLDYDLKTTAPGSQAVFTTRHSFGVLFFGKDKVKPLDIGKAYDQITHLWESSDFNMNNGVEQHKKAISFVESRGRALDIGCGFIELFMELGYVVRHFEFDKHPERHAYLIVEKA